MSVGDESRLSRGKHIYIPFRLGPNLYKNILEIKVSCKKGYFISMRIKLFNIVLLLKEKLQRFGKLFETRQKH